MRADETRSSALRALSVLDALAARPLTLTEIAANTRLPLPTVHRYARELIAWGGVERRPDGTYTLGLHVWQLGALTQFDRLVRQSSASVLEQVAAATGHAAVVSTCRGESIVPIEQRRGNNPSIWMTPIGGQIPWSLSSAGVLSLANLADEELERRIEEQNGGDHAVQHAIARARTVGYATALGAMLKNQGTLSVLVPGQLADGLALTLVFTDQERAPERFLETLRLAAASLSIALKRHADAHWAYNPFDAPSS